MDDLISRKDAIDAVETIGFDFSDSDLSAVELEEVCEAIGEVRQEWLQRIKRLPSAQPETCKSIEDILQYLDYVLHPIVSPDNWNVYAELYDMISDLPSAQPDGKIMLDKEAILQAGYQGREVDFRIGGRLFAIREKAQ